MRIFPQSFLWGAATSAHQVEGGLTNDWSEWERATAQSKAEVAKQKDWPDHILGRSPNPFEKDNYISGRAANHYNRYEEDFAIAESLNHTTHRFSLAWSRIEPHEGRFNEEAVEHYKNVITTLKERGIEPFVTLWHWPLPLWVRDTGSWENKETITRFVRYATKMAEALPEVRFWVTINEPLVYASHAYLKGTWPPQRKNPFAYFRALRHLTHAHHRTYEAIKNILPEAQVGIAKNNVDFSGWFAPVTDWWHNRRFLNKIQDHQDFIGLNYYFGSCRSEEKSDMGWNICPQGIYRVLKDVAHHKKPIYITENGIADARDICREQFIKDHLREVHRAIEDGVDVRGYFYWSLLDNFEWDKGFWPRFGLVEVDYNTIERTVRSSARTYAHICKNNSLILDS